MQLLISFGISFTQKSTGDNRSLVCTNMTAKLSPIRTYGDSDVGDLTLVTICGFSGDLFSISATLK